MRIFHVLLIGLMLSSFGAIAQNVKPLIEFKSKTHDFGTLKEENGKQVYSFEFVNKGTSPIIIKNVRSSCGCTTPDWSKAPVAPGQKGFVKTTFDPKNRPGSFNKSITVTSNSDPAISILHITGTVAPRVKTVLDSFPRMMSGLRMPNNHFPMTKVKSTEIKEASLEVYNDTDSVMTVSFRRVPAHLAIKLVPEKIAPKKRAKVVVVYDASKKNDWGFVTDYLDVLVNGKFEPRNRFTISADIIEDFGQLSKEELAKAPKLEFEERVFNFGELQQGEKAEHTFLMKNTGKSDLLIRKTKTSCGCTAISPQSKIIKAGESTELKVVFNSRGKRGRQNKRITVITNAPTSSSVDLRVMGNVVMPNAN
ncbi:DUF1573 domain-containing protein [Ancylomarina salipaludis]|uniref:DUF1573 domain-containing protein n=1 Tax=Ancylomarina salipaludis TaxID=2501299 RepID=A0A4V1N0L7_9BACT|nr:DUF1573 domain-containing protein [Ancylomarina salipaludis]RXQ97717.1 DUF1573 domain-containing protein [Ancylomarina salipaludis]